VEKMVNCSGKKTPASADGIALKIAKSATPAAIKMVIQFSMIGLDGSSLT
jgi:hypothetical protein